MFVCSNSWLDVGYGAKLQEYLLHNAHIEVIYESVIERQFTTADINTVISVIRKTTVNDDDTTRFVQLRDKFELAVCPCGKRREIIKSRAELIAASTNPQNIKFIGDKWGGKYLHGLDIYHHILNKYSNKLIRIGNVADVRFGIKSGVNDFFYLTMEVIKEWSIEPKFYRPVMTTPQESRSIAVNSANLRYQLFMCHLDKTKLQGAKVLAYIEWGERQGYHRRRSVSSRPRWYDLGHKINVHLGMNNLVGDTVRTFFALDEILFTHNFQIFHAEYDVAANLCMDMNSTLFQLTIGTVGIVNYGGGVLRIETYENANIAVVNPNLLPALDAELFASSDWDILKPSPERRQIDDAVFDALALTAGERDAIYAGVAQLVTNRKCRARSA